MSSSSTPLPRTPPEPFSVDDVKVAVDFSALDVFNDAAAVGGHAADDLRAAEKNAIEAGVNDGLYRKDVGNENGNGNGKYMQNDSDNMLDPLLFAAALASGPHVTRNHYHHAFFPGSDDTEWSDRLRFASKQAPRSARLGRDPSSYAPENSDSSRSASASPEFKAIGDRNDLKYAFDLTPLTTPPSLSSSVSSLAPPSPVEPENTNDNYVSSTPTVTQAIHRAKDVHVRCMVRTRVPTPHGEVFLHLYHNDRDDKEHLAIVIDPAQLDAEDGVSHTAPFIRSKSLDAVWHEDETPMERITRGAYVGRLRDSGEYTVSSPQSPSSSRTVPNSNVPAPLVRIHSECFTGETIGSMRCDCGEQLDEAMRRIAQPISFLDASTGAPCTIPGRGAVVYMRQEGRGIGLLSKLRAYNLQDLGHDTVQANLLLGHKADERGYEVAAAIMEDLGLGGAQQDVEGGGEGVRLLTNNPDKVQKLAEAGVRVVERVSMVPRTWKCQAESVSVDIHHSEHTHSQQTEMDDEKEEAAARLRSAGATLIGASATRGPELEKYLRTKVLRMGHMLSLPSSEAALSV